MFLQKNTYSRAFTIVELLVIIVVIGILAGIAGIYYQKADVRARNTSRLTVLTNYRDMFSTYAAHEESYPSVPQAGHYCLGGGLATSDYIATNGGGTVPNTVSPYTDVEMYCGDNILDAAKRYASYPPLEKSLVTIADAGTDNSQLSANLGANKTSLGPFVEYIDAGSGTVKLRLTGVFDGDTCPDGTAKIVDYDGGKVVLCGIDLNKAYAVTYTAEAWPFTP